MNSPVDKTLDTTGLLCPEPLMLLHNAIRTMQSGQVIEVIATDPSTTRDITKFCNFLGHALLVQEERGESLYYQIRKA